MARALVRELILTSICAADHAILCKGKTPDAPASESFAHVTLDQAAALVNRSKKTLERLKRRKSNPLPNPDIEGGGGVPDEWKWDTLRPWLEAEFKRRLPKLPPSLRGGR